MLRFRSLCAVFVACIVLSASLLSGCGGGSSSVPGSGATPPPGGAGIESIASANAALAAGGGCGLRTVFVYRGGTVRGYPLDAAGETQPCAVIPVSNVWGPITISRYGYLHVAAFQNGTGSYPVYAPNANGNAGPVRLVTADRDRYSLATDSHVTDYIADGTNQTNCWEVAVATGDGSTQRICTTETGTRVEALAVEPDDRLVVVISDYAGPPRIELYANPASTSPQLLQTITGPATLVPAGAVEFGAATDPATGDIYVYAAGPSAGPRVLVFASNASGNVAPKRVLNVPDATGWGNGQRGAGSNVLAVDDRGQLYLGLRMNVVVEVYAAGASGNAGPVRAITDASAPTTNSGFPLLLPTSVAVRTSIH
jgi:hypothetical protein